MYRNEIEQVADSAVKKTQFLKGSLFRYFLLSVFAGFFIFVGTEIAFTTGAILYTENTFYYKIGIGATFSTALILIYFAGAELFTGNTFVLSVGWLSHKITFPDMLKVLMVCYLGNLVGGAFLSWIYVLSGTAHGATEHLILKVAAAKMNLPIAQIFFKAILANFIVCLAVWTSYKTKSETARIMLTLLIIFAFATPSFEHSIANMSLFSIALMLPYPDTMNIAAASTNLLWATLGNIVGGALLLGLPYWYVSGAPKHNAL